jgi:hypothetical protein
MPGTAGILEEGESSPKGVLRRKENDEPLIKGNSGYRTSPRISPVRTPKVSLTGPVPAIAITANTPTPNKKRKVETPSSTSTTPKQATPGTKPVTPVSKAATPGSKHRTPLSKTGTPKSVAVTPKSAKKTPIVNAIGNKALKKKEDAKSGATGVRKIRHKPGVVALREMRK